MKRFLALWDRFRLWYYSKPCKECYRTDRNHRRSCSEWPWHQGRK